MVDHDPVVVKRLDCNDVARRQHGACERLAQRRQYRFAFAVAHDPSGVAADRDDDRPADLRRRHANPDRVQVIRTVVAADPAVRANLLAALAGPGAPVGVVSCFEREDVVTVSFDDEITRPELIDDLITIESHFVPVPESKPIGDEEAAHLAAAGLADPELDASRILERHLAGLE